MRHGRGVIALGAGRGPSPAREFYEHIGYRGASRMTRELALTALTRYGPLAKGTAA